MIILFSIGKQFDTVTCDSFVLWHEFSPQDWYNANVQEASHLVVSGVQEFSLLFDHY